MIDNVEWEEYNVPLKHRNRNRRMDARTAKIAFYKLNAKRIAEEESNEPSRSNDRSHHGRGQ